MSATRRLGYSLAMPTTKKKPAASQKPFTKKIGLKPDTEIVLLNAPPDAARMIGEFPRGCSLTTKLTAEPGFVLLFVLDSKELGKHLPKVAKKISEGATLWICYPKGGSDLESDLDRDVLRKRVAKAGLTAVSNVAVDETWSALRFKRPAPECCSG